MKSVFKDKTDSVVLLNWISSIDKQRLSKYLGNITLETMKKVDQTILISLGVVL